MAPKKFRKGWCCRKPRCAALSPITDGQPDYHFTASLERNFIDLHIENEIERCLIDSGAAFSCISKHMLKKIKPDADIQRSSLFSAVGVCGEVHPILGETMLQLTFGHFKINQKFRIFETIHAKIILGLDFLGDHQVKTDFGKMTITIQEGETSNSSDSFVNLHSVSIPTRTEISLQTGVAETVSEVTITPHSEMVLPLSINRFKQGTTLLLEPKANLVKLFYLAGGKTVSNVNKGLVAYRLLNPTNQTIVLFQLIYKIFRKFWI